MITSRPKHDHREGNRSEREVRKKNRMFIDFLWVSIICPITFLFESHSSSAIRKLFYFTNSHLFSITVANGKDTKKNGTALGHEWLGVRGCAFSQLIERKPIKSERKMKMRARGPSLWQYTLVPNGRYIRNRRLVSLSDVNAIDPLTQLLFRLLPSWCCWL